MSHVQSETVPIFEEKYKSKKHLMVTSHGFNNKNADKLKMRWLTEEFDDFMLLFKKAKLAKQLAFNTFYII